MKEKDILLIENVVNNYLEIEEFISHMEMKKIFIQNMILQYMNIKQEKEFESTKFKICIKDDIIEIIRKYR